MTGASDILLLRPVWLAALPFLLLLAYFLRRRRRGLGAWEQAVDQPLLAAMQRVGHVLRRAPGPWLTAPLLSAVVIALALTGPAQRLPAPAFRNLDGLILAVDLSPSLASGGGLADAQAVAALALDRAGGRPAALVLFTGEAFLASPLSTDPAAAASLIGVLAPDTMPVGGSRPDRAIDMATDILTEARLAHADLLLISDGGGLGPAAEAAARRFAQAGGRLVTVYVSPHQPQNGAPPPAPDALARLATDSGGTAETAADPAAVAALLNRADARLAESGLASIFFRDLGRWLLLLALPPALLLFRRTA